MPEKKNYRQFLEKLQQMVLRYDKYGYNYAKHVFNDVKNQHKNEGVSKLNF